MIASRFWPSFRKSPSGLWDWTQLLGRKCWIGPALATSLIAGCASSGETDARPLPSVDQGGSQGSADAASGQRPQPDTGTGGQPDAGAGGGRDVGSDADMGTSGGLARRTTRNLFFVGNSLMSFDFGDEEPPFESMYWMCRIAQAVGDGCSYGKQHIGGAAFSDHLPLSAATRGALATDGLDGLSLSGRFDNEVPDPEAAIAIIEQARQLTPNLPVYLYIHWPSTFFDEEGFPLHDGDRLASEADDAEWSARMAQWRALLLGEYQQSREALRERIAETLGGTVKAIPAGPIVARMMDGPLSGLRTQELFLDTSHMSPNGYWLIGLIKYMVFFGHKPTPAEAGAPSFFSADRVQSIIDFAWDDLQNYPAAH